MYSAWYLSENSVETYLAVGDEHYWTKRLIM